MPTPSTLRPFLKWAGGKRQLLPQLRRFYPVRIARYIEPFVGSGAVFFDLSGRGHLSSATATLSDENADLIGTYHRVADSTAALVAALTTLADGHRRGGREHYYEIRDRRFNPERAAWRAAGGEPTGYPVTLAAMLIYLNRTGYNGLFRLNQRGEYNVPAGRYDSPVILNTALLEATGAALRSCAISIHCSAFDAALGRVERGDFVYLDPPYAPLSVTSNFRSYTARRFADDDQRRLRDAVVALAARGAQVLLSNSTAPAIVRLYDDRQAQRAGLRCWRVPARRAINSRASARGPIDELVVTNLPCQEIDREPPGDRRALPQTG